MTAAVVAETTPRRARLRAIDDGTSGETRAVVRALIYVRISDDPNETRAGVERQERASRALCDLLGWCVVDVPGLTKRPGVVEDNDKSNSIARKEERENFTALLDAMESGVLAGVVDAVVFFDQDRWVKDPAEWGRWMSLQLRGRGLRVAICDAHGGGSEVDLSSPDGFMLSTFRMMSSNTDTMRQVKRIRAFTAEQRRRGKLARVNYGWERVAQISNGVRVSYRDELHPEHSEIVQTIARRLLSGETGTAIARDLNARGVAVPSKRWEQRFDERTQWSPSTIRKLMLRPTNVAVLLDDEGNETALDMPPILTRTQWNELRALYADPTRRTITDNRVRHLLASLATCSVCGGTARRKVITRKTSDGGTYRYECYTCKLGNCATVEQALADRVVVDTLLAWLRSADLRDVLGEDDSDERAQLSAQIDELQSELSSYIADSKRKMGDPLRVSKSELDGHKSALVPQIDELQRRRTALSASRPGVELGLAVARSRDALVAWDELTLHQQRELLTTFVDVKIKPQNGRTLDPTRVSVTLKR